MLPRILERASEYGFAVGQESPHATRTLLLVDLQQLLEACSHDSGPDDYRAAVMDENALHKSTRTTRQKTIAHLRKLYALDPDVLLFHALRDLWGEDPEAQPLLACQCAVARDPLFRSTASHILDLSPETAVTAEQMAELLGASFPDRYSASMLLHTGQYVASSWQQSGHLRGRAKKVRDRAECRPAAVAYALLLSHLCGARGDGLFETLWARLLDRPVGEIRDQAVVASRRGWIDYRHAGGVTEVSFSYLMRDEGSGDGALD